MPKQKILDSWALLAWLLDQPAAGRIEALLERAEAQTLQLSMSWLNAGEVYSMAARKLGKLQAEELLNRLPSLPIHLTLPEVEDILAAARLKSQYRISYADAFAAALAQRENADLVTGDPEIRALDGIVRVDWIGAA